MTKEIELRMAAATSAWQAFYSFWGCRTDIAIKRVIFRGIVTSTLLSGLMIAVFSDGEKQTLDAAHLKLARRSLAANAVRQVRQYMSLGTTDDELRIARLKFWQNIARDPEHHTQIITTFFGTFKFSNDNLRDDKYHSRCMQMQEDLQYMRQLDLDEDFWTKLDNKPENLLTDEWLRDYYTNIRSIGRLRAQHHTATFPPPGYVAPEVVAPHGPLLPAEVHTCKLLDNTNGKVCGYTCNTKKGLKMHQNTAAVHTTTKPISPATFVVNNRCPWCKKIYGSLEYVRNHVANSLKKGVCVCVQQEVENMVIPCRSVTCIGVKCAKCRLKHSHNIVRM